MKDRAITVLNGQGHSVRLSDLYAMRFKAVVDADDFIDPADNSHFDLQAEQMRAAERGTFAPDILIEQQKLLWADAVLFQFPLWWYSVPAIMKGWFDRVLAYGFAYGSGRNLIGRRAMLVVTTGGPPRNFSPAIQKAINEMLTHVQRGVLSLCGFDVLPPFAAYGATNASPEQQEHYLTQYTQILLALNQIKPVRHGLAQVTLFNT